MHLKIKKYFLLFIFLSAVLFLAACNSSLSKIGQCHLRDSRFACHGSLQASGQGKLEFTKIPSKQVFQLTQFSLQKVDKNGDSMPYKDCSGDTGDVSTQGVFKFNCQAIEPGAYYVKFKLSHRMPKNYQPRKSESCVLSRSGIISAWECTSSGEFKYILQ